MNKALLFGSLVVVMMVGLGGLEWHYRKMFDEPLLHTQPVYLDIRKGTSVKEIADTLNVLGVMRYGWCFRYAALREGVNNRLRFGEYEIPVGTSLRKLINLLVQGRVRLYPLTLVEGWTVQQAMETAWRHPAIRPDLKGKSQDEIGKILGINEPKLEGLLFPDTYYISRDTSDISLLKQAYLRMQDVLRETWNARVIDVPFASPYQALIMASIVEKETRRNEERARIAGVFIRRMRKGMLLQTDPTVIYGLGDQFDGDLRDKDLTRDTPYNTYRHAGLPPTPIALPGKASIQAVLHPEAGDSLFFVARGDGSHVFSATLEEHQRAVNTFQRRH